MCNLIKTTPGVKKGSQELKQVLLKMIWNEMGGQDFLVLTGLKLLVMINSQQTIFISGAQGPLILMGLKVD